MKKWLEKVLKVPNGLPLVLLATIKGRARLEANGGEELYLEVDKWRFLLFRAPVRPFPDEPLYQVTHLQKRSRMGFLLYWPLCFHVWFTFRYQTEGLAGWRPGTEKVLYWRLGLWRWDAGDSKYIGPGTWYGPGLHWD